MGFKFGYFLSGLTSGVEETIEAQTKSNVEAVANRVKTAAETYIEQQKQYQKTKEELRTTVNSVAAIKWSDGTFTDQQLIALASNPDAAKAVIEAVKKDPSITSRISKDFVKALDTVPTNVTPQQYIDSLFTRTKATEADIKKMFGPEESFFGRLSSQKNMLAATKTAAKYGVSLEDLFGTQTTGAKAVQRNVEVNFAEFTKKPEFKDLMDKAKIEVVEAQNSGDPVRIKTASENLQRLVLADDAGKIVNKSESQIQSELITEILDAKKKGETQKASDLEATLEQRKKLSKGPESGEKVTQANLITLATKNLASTLQLKLPPGSYITTINTDGSIKTDLKDLKQEKRYLEAIKESNDYIVSFYTNNGVPKSDLHANALFGRAIPVDKQGRFYSPSLPELEALLKGQGSGPAPARRAGQAAPAAAPMAPTGEVATPPMASSAAPQQTRVSNREATGRVADPAVVARATADIAALDREINNIKNNRNINEEQRSQALAALEAEKKKAEAAIGQQQVAPARQPAAAPVLKWNPQTKKWE